MRYKWSQGKINPIVILGYFSLPLRPCMHACLLVYEPVCLCFLFMLARFISFFCFSYFPPPKARKWLRCFLNKTMCFFVADNFRSVCVCKILHFILFNDWHTLNYTIASCPMPLCYVLVSFVLLFDFFFVETKIYQFTWELFSNDLVHCRNRFLQVGWRIQFAFSTPRASECFIFRRWERNSHTAESTFKETFC